MKKKILICAGGTGGHIFPAQVVASQLLRKSPNIDVLFIGGGLDGNPYFDREKYRYLAIPSSTLGGRNPIKLFKAASKIAKGAYLSRRLLLDYKPDLIVGFGSHHSLPVLLAALSKNIPILLHESNSIPGKVIRLISRYAEMTAIQFPSAAARIRGKAVVTSMPLRDEFCHNKQTPQEARMGFGLNPHVPTILVFGGSQGAQAINEQFIASLPLLQKQIHFQVLHYAGKNAHLNAIKGQYQELGIKACVKDFEANMPQAWKAADCVLSRSGAGTIAEQLASAVPGLLIPYPHAADNHQMENARFMEEIGGAKVIPQSELSPEKLSTELGALFASDKSRLSFMQKMIQNYHKQEQKKEFKDLIFDLLEHTS